MCRLRSFLSLSTVVATLVFQIIPQASYAGGKLGVYGIYMVPTGNDAKEYSKPGWGLGLEGVLPIPRAANLFAGVAGLEWVNLMTANVSFQDQVTGLRTEQQTNQNYYRIYIGGEIGGHGDGFVRPHAGVNLALVVYSISTDVVVPDDYNRQNEIRQSLRSETKAGFGYDITLGLDLNFSNTIALDGGVRYLTSFSVPEQLGTGAVTIHPGYFQVYLGIGASFDMVRDW